MGKLAGSVCILTGCMVLLVCWMERMKRSRQSMQEIVRFFRSWEYSLQIRQMRVTEFLETYPYTVPELRLVADEVRRTLLSHTYSTGQEVWEEVLEKHKSVLGVPEDAYQIFIRAADGFFGTNSRQAQQCIQACTGMLECVIKEEQKNYREKRRVYMPVGMLTGVMIVILLI